MSGRGAYDPTRYPGRNLSARERQLVDAWAIPLDELTDDHIVYSLGRQVETSFANFYGVARDLFGDDVARCIAFEVGRRHGGRGYARLLETLGTPGAGSPVAMAQYQDLAHALRGPKHSLALFAEYDGERCVVSKPECGYFDAARPDVAPFVGAFEAGCFEGYRAADRNLETVDVRGCRWQGAGSCSIEFRWRRNADAKVPGP